MATNGKMQLENCIREQQELTTAVVKLLRNVKKDPTNRKTEAYYEVRLTSLTSYRQEFREIHRRIMREGDEGEVKAEYLDKEISEKFEEAYLEAVTHLKQELSMLSRSASTSATAGNTPTNIANTGPLNTDSPLPEIKLPTFNGRHTDWPNFKEIFVARVHNSTRLTDLQRLHYLRSVLVEEAAQDIQHITMIGENYNVAWQMLTEIYDNNRILFSHYMNILEMLPTFSRDDATGLKRFTQTCRSCISSIQKLGIDIVHQNQILVHFLIKKLPPNIRQEWDHATRKQKTVPTLDELCRVLDEQYQMIITSKGTKAIDRPKVEGHRREVHSSFVNQKSISCCLCKKDSHPVRACPEFLALNVGDRRAAVIRLKLCFNCLSQNHTVVKCNSRHKCVTCGGKHHTSIHEEPRRNTTPTTSCHASTVTNTGVKGRSSGTETHRNFFTRAELTAEQTNQDVAKRELDYEVLLPTAVVIITNSEDRPQFEREFLHQGSQASFITERLAQVMCLP